MKQLILKYSFLVFILTFCFKTSGQNENCIDSDQRIGCVPFEVSIDFCGKLKEDGSIPATIYEYEPGDTTAQTFHIYNLAGVYSVRQILNDEDGVKFDSLFVDYFTAVGKPDILANFISCKNKEAFISIDSSSYDFYIITNNVNDDSDTIRKQGHIEKSFTNSTTNEVKFSINARYDNGLPCQITDTFNLTLIDGIVPRDISSISEFKSISIEQLSIPNVNYILKTSFNSIPVDSLLSVNQTTLSITPSSDYNSITLEALDFCGNLDPYLELTSFKSATTFENNRNTVEHLSGGLIDGNEEYLKFNFDTLILSSNIDNNIVCGSFDCYAIRNQNSYETYDFEHLSTGNCDTSFSIDTPPAPVLKIDNSKDSTYITLLNNTETDFITLDNRRIALTNNQAAIPYTSNCFELSQTNKCDQTSDIKEYCPIVFNTDNSELKWNEALGETFSLAWLSITDDTTIFETNGSSDYFFGISQYFAQEFCVIIISNETGSISNKLCFEDQSFLFIPELAYKEDDALKLRQKYLASFSFNLYDINGNLIQEWNENSTLTLENLDTGTYFYIFEGNSENGSQIDKKGSILLKD